MVSWSKPEQRAELKVSLSSGEVRTALELLGLSSPRKAGSVAFLEDLTIGANLPLFAAGLILRLRVKPGDGTMESTVKLRPVRRSALGARWLPDVSAVTLEQDWGLHRVVVAAALKAAKPKDALENAFAGTTRLTELFDEHQAAFLRECTGMPVNIEELALLGPVETLLWKDVKLDGLKVDVERWSVGPLDFVELSMKEGDLSVAAARSAALLAAVTNRGLPVDRAAQSKTETVLRYLAQRN
ncbi:MAG: hypothetical protein ACKV2O_25315 [Acidimicrobiales bacterium]